MMVDLIHGKVADTDSEGFWGVDGHGKKSEFEVGVDPQLHRDEGIPA